MATNTIELVKEILKPEKSRQAETKITFTPFELSSLDPSRDAITSSTVLHESNVLSTTATDLRSRTTSTDSSFNNQIHLEDSDVFPEGGWTAWRVVLGSFFGLIAVAGFVNSIGAVQAYISTNQLEALSESQIAWIFSIFLFFAYSFSGLAGPFFDSFGPYHLGITGSALFVGGVMIVSVSSKYYQFFLALGLCIGIGIGMLMTPLIAIIGHWFNYKRGTAIGAATVGGSLGGVIFPLILRALYASVGFAWAIRVVGFLSFAVLALALVLIKPRLARTPFHFRVNSILDFRSLTDMRFAWLTVANFLGELAVVNGLTFLTSYALRQGKSENLAYTLLTLLNSTGMLGRWLSGVIADQLGRFNTLIVICIMAFTTILAIWLPFGHSTAGLIAFSVVHGFSNGGILSLAPVCCGQICKARDYGKRYGTMFFVTAFGVLLGMPISGALIKPGPDGYNNLIIFTGALYVGTTLCVILSRYCIVGFKFKAKV
jgi:MFS family permease